MDCCAAITALNKARSTLIKNSDQTGTQGLLDEFCSEPQADFTGSNDGDVFRQTAALYEPLDGGCRNQAKPA
jgi:hypothetical protein